MTTSTQVVKASFFNAILNHALNSNHKAIYIESNTKVVVEALMEDK